MLLAKGFSGKSTCLLQVFLSAEPGWALGKTGVSDNKCPVVPHFPAFSLNKAAFEKGLKWPCQCCSLNGGSWGLWDCAPQQIHGLQRAEALALLKYLWRAWDRDEGCWAWMCTFCLWKEGFCWEDGRWEQDSAVTVAHGRTLTKCRSSAWGCAG